MNEPKETKNIHQLVVEITKKLLGNRTPTAWESHPNCLGIVPQLLGNHTPTAWESHADCLGIEAHKPEAQSLNHPSSRNKKGTLQ